MSEPRVLRHAHGTLTLDRCRVMGIVNRTPDSFYDGGRMALTEAVEFALRLVSEGADILDLSGVKAGPGRGVSEAEEARRVLPLVEAISETSAVPISIETTRPLIARAAVNAGASIVNDVAMLTDEGQADVCASTGAALILMHNGGQLRGRPRHPRYEDVVGSVLDGWRASSAIASAHGVRHDQIMVDPGLDFGKTAYHSLELMRRLDELVACEWPVLVAPSRKDIVGESLALPLSERLEGTLALVALSVWAGAACVRVHDVVASVRTVHMVEAVMDRRAPLSPVRGLWE